MKYLFCLLVLFISAYMPVAGFAQSKPVITIYWTQRSYWTHAEKNEQSFTEDIKQCNNRFTEELKLDSSVFGKSTSFKLLLSCMERNGWDSNLAVLGLEYSVEQLIDSLIDGSAVNVFLAQDSVVQDSAGQDSVTQEALQQ